MQKWDYIEYRICSSILTYSAFAKNLRMVCLLNTYSYHIISHVMRIIKFFIFIKCSIPAWANKDTNTTEVSMIIPAINASYSNAGNFFSGWF